MPVREARQKFRELRNSQKTEIEQREEVIDAKDRKINNLERQLRGMDKRDPADVARGKRSDVLMASARKIGAQLSEARIALSIVVELLTEAEFMEGVDISELDRLRTEVKPGWMLMGDFIGAMDEYMNAMVVREHEPDWYDRAIEDISRKRGGE